MRAHADRQIAIGHERREVERRQRRKRRVDHGQFEVAVGKSPAVAREMLHHGQNAGGEEPVGGSPAESRNSGRILGVGAVPDHAMAVGER